MYDFLYPIQITLRFLAKRIAVNLDGKKTRINLEDQRERIPRDKSKQPLNSQEVNISKLC